MRPSADTPYSGGRVPPCWRILPPGGVAAESEIPLVLSAGPGFGSGRHPTTQLCLRAIAALAPRERPGWRMLDFGSGSGILAIAAAKLGASVAAVEIDPSSLASIAAHAELNEVAGSLRVSRVLLEAPGPFELVVANILRPVLLDFAPELVARLAPGGALVLSGLLPMDVPEVSVRYAELLEGRRPERYQQEDWSALVWRERRP